MAQSELAQAWSGFDDARRQRLLARMSPEQKKALRAELEGTSTTTTEAPKSFLDKITEIQPHQAVHSASDLGREVARGVGNIGAGGLGVLLHPIKSAEGALETVGGVMTAPGEMAAGTPFKETVPGKILTSLHDQPLETIESGLGQTAAMGGAGELVKTVPGGVGRVLTKTTPKVVGELAKDTAEANKVATENAAKETTANAEKHAKDVEKIEGKRKVELGKHFEKTKAAEEANAQAQGKVSRKAAINRGVERLDTEVRSDLEKLEEKVHKEANQKYNDLRKVLKNEKAERVQAVNEQGQPVGQAKNITEHLDDVAHAPLRGTEAETPIMKSLSKRVANGEVDLTYDDLQGYREELGRELRKGTLPPDVFTGYKNLLSAIDDAMDKIAARKGLKPVQDAARAFYRQYAQTFLDSDAVARKALDSPERGGVAKAYLGKDQSGIEQIAKYDPQVAQRLNGLRGYQAEGKALPSKTGKLTSLPKLEPKPATPPAPAPVVPEVKAIGPEDIRAAKTTSLNEKGIPRVRKVGHGMVSAVVGLPALFRAFHGNFSGTMGTAGEALAGYGATEAFARMLENPAVQRMLTNPTAADIAQIPPELRGPQLQPILDAANAKGIKVSDALYAAAGAPRRKTVGQILQPVQ